MKEKNVEELKKELIIQKELRIRDNIYQYTQITMAYNSNRLSSNSLTEQQVRSIFDNSSVTSQSELDINTNDFNETKNHFKLFDYILDNIDIPLSIEMILELNKILKANTVDINEITNQDGFKGKQNSIEDSNIIPSTPENVLIDLQKLLTKYNSIQNKTLEDIIDFHFYFECIHPFTKGNGRIGRIILFKECLKNNIMPFIIFDDDKSQYLSGLNTYLEDKDYLIETIRAEQYLYQEICDQLLTNN